MSKVTIYSVEGCKPCEEAKHFLETEGIDYEEMSVKERDFETEGEEGDMKMVKVPVICVGGECTSGYSEDWLKERLDL